MKVKTYQSVVHAFTNISAGDMHVISSDGLTVLCDKPLSRSLLSVDTSFQVHQHVRNARKNLVSRRVVTDKFVADDLPGGIWKVSSTRDVS